MRLLSVLNIKIFESSLRKNFDVKEAAKARAAKGNQPTLRPFCLKPDRTVLIANTAKTDNHNMFAATRLFSPSTMRCPIRVALLLLHLSFFCPLSARCDSIIKLPHGISRYASSVGRYPPNWVAVLARSNRTLIPFPSQYILERLAFRPIVNNYLITIFEAELPYVNAISFRWSAQ